MKPRAVVVGAVLLALLGAPLTAEAQPAGKVYRVGILQGTTPASTWRAQPFNQVFLDELRKLGYVEDRNFVIEYRTAEGEWQRLPDLAAELVTLKMDAIVVGVCGAPLNAARRATNTIPIVVAACNDDMVATGIVASLSRPGGNITGLSKVTPELAAKRLELLREAVPKVSRVAVLWDPGYSDFSADWRELRAAARVLGVTLQPVEARGRHELTTAFSTMTREHAEAVITFSDTTTYGYPRQVAELAAKNRLPMMAPFREIPEAGGLISYGPNVHDLFRRAATYVDKILKGAKPADLPIEQPTKFELVINMKTAKALGLTIPPSVLVRADQIIE
jgi:putative ABC transport system substrate-binding protein